jgi:hypothetical protein
MSQRFELFQRRLFSGYVYPPNGYHSHVVQHASQRRSPSARSS